MESQTKEELEAFLKKLGLDLSCPICKKLFDDPVLDSENRTTCKKCLENCADESQSMDPTEEKIPSNKFIEKLLNDLVEIQKNASIEASLQDKKKSCFIEYDGLKMRLQRSYSHLIASLQGWENMNDVERYNCLVELELDTIFPYLDDEFRAFLSGFTQGRRHAEMIMHDGRPIYPSVQEFWDKNKVEHVQWLSEFLIQEFTKTTINL